MKKRRWLLPFVLMMILVPTVSALVFSGFGLYHQQQAMETMAQQYSQNLAQSIVYGENGPSRERPLQRHRRMEMFLKMLTFGPPVPGWIATTGRGGMKLQGSPGSQITPPLQAAIRKALETGEMQSLTLKSDRHPPASATVCPYPDGVRTVVVVISHYLVPGPVMKAISFQPIVSIIVSVIALVGIFLLWRWCVMPLRNLAEKIESIEWGSETLDAGPSGPLPELREMKKALTELSASAVDRMIIKKNYVGDIVRTQEEERTRLAREIHDSPLQTVSSLIQRIQLALRGLSRDDVDRERIAAHLSAAQEAALAAVQDMRDVCDRLSPPWMSLGAERAVEEICNRLSRIHDVALTYAVTGNASSLDEKQLLALCRIIQEGVSNAVRHGHAHAVDVKLDCTAQPFRLTIRDDGEGIDSGIDPELLRVNGHRGIASMTERASLVGASFSISRGENGGTLITVTLPPISDEKPSPSEDGENLTA